MAVKMALVKGPNLQRLIVLVLLSLAGLGYPPDFCEAIKCYCSKPRGKTCENAKDGILECKPEEQGCKTLKQELNGEKYEEKVCDTDGWNGLGKGVFQCIQNKLGQSGDCIKGKEEVVLGIACDCGVKTPDCKTPAPGPAPEPGRRRREATNDIFSRGTVREGPGSGNTHIEMCTCRTELCNTGTGGPGVVTDGSGGNTSPKDNTGTGAGHGVPVGRTLIQVGHSSEIFQAFP